MINSNVTAKWYAGKKERLLDQSDRIMYTVARMTLDMTESTIPKAIGIGSGTLRRTTMASGVRGSDAKYYIQSPTNYAKYVYERNDSRTNWSTPGTHSKWFSRIWNKNKNTIIDRAIERNKLK